MLRGRGETGIRVVSEDGLWVYRVSSRQAPLRSAVGVPVLSPESGLVRLSPARSQDCRAWPWACPLLPDDRPGLPLYVYLVFVEGWPHCALTGPLPLEPRFSGPCLLVILGDS